jgi:hypothetical protein
MQIIIDAVVPALQSDVPTKRPIYDNKKRKQQLKAKTEEGKQLFV